MTKKKEGEQMCRDQRLLLHTFIYLLMLHQFQNAVLACSKDTTYKSTLSLILDHRFESQLEDFTSSEY